MSQKDTEARYDRLRAEALQEMLAGLREYGGDTSTASLFDKDESALTWLWARQIISHGAYQAGLLIVKERRERQAAHDLRARQQADLQYVETQGTA